MKILKINCWLVWFLSMDNKKRLSGIVDLIKKYNPDIVALQEIWLKKYVNYFKKNLIGYYFIDSNGFFNKTGLVTLSKKKPKSSQIKHFEITKNHNFEEKIARKGFHLLKFDKFFFLNTHLYCPKNKKEESINTKQFELIKKQKANVLAGDFNSENLKIKGFKSDGVKEKTLSLKNKYANAKKNILKVSEKVDYIFSKSVFGVKLVKKPLVSDHYGIFAQVKFR